MPSRFLPLLLSFFPYTHTRTLSSYFVFSFFFPFSLELQLAFAGLFQCISEDSCRQVLFDLTRTHFVLSQHNAYLSHILRNEKHVYFMIMLYHAVCALRERSERIGSTFRYDDIHALQDSIKNIHELVG